MKKYSGIIIAFVLCILMALPVNAQPANVVDEADLLTPDEESQLTSELIDIRERQQFLGNQRSIAKEEG